MVAPGFLEKPEVRRWLNGVEPAWTMLEFNSLNALRHEPSASNHAIRLQPDLADAEISESAVTANALILLRRAADTGGLKLTATGNLSRGRGDVRSRGVKKFALCEVVHTSLRSVRVIHRLREREAHAEKHTKDRGQSAVARCPVAAGTGGTSDRRGENETVVACPED